jgi:hypothetical protein
VCIGPAVVFQVLYQRGGGQALGSPEAHRHGRLAEDGRGHRYRIVYIGSGRLCILKTLIFNKDKKSHGLQIRDIGVRLMM